MKSQSAANRVLEEFKRKRVPDIPEKAFFNPPVQVVRVKREGRPLQSEEEVALALSKMVKVFAPAATMMANNRFVVGLRSKEDAARCISLLLKAYGPGKPALKQRVEIGAVNLEASDRLPVEDAVKVLQSPAVAKTYAVQPGDTAWKIAQDVGISVGTLKRLNPSMDVSALKPGAEVNVSEGKPRLTVVTKRKVARIESIPFETQTAQTPALPKRARKVVRKGEVGERQVVEEVTLENGREVSRRLVSKKMKKEPVAQVVWLGRGGP